MALVYANRVKDTSTTTGTGTYTLANSPPTGFQSFGNGIGNANTCYYTATDGTDWEVGLGTYTAAGTTLARTSVLASSNSNAAVNWTSGTRTVWCDLPASVIQALAPPIGVAGGGTGLATLTAHNVLVGNGTSSLLSVAPSTSGNVLTSNGTDWTSAAPAGSITLLGTANTTGASTISVTGLTLTSYKFLNITFTGLSSTAASWALQFNGVTVATGASAANTFIGIIEVDLAGSGVAISSAALAAGGTATVTSMPSGLTTGSTSVSLSLGSGNFDGSPALYVYGVK